ncbi:hypothetical protein LEP1GSC116_0643, partial [Leptospira interrogans serovar Icterohaemorrhagiae str. Verdun HP]
PKNKYFSDFLENVGTTTSFPVFLGSNPDLKVTIYDFFRAVICN